MDSKGTVSRRQYITDDSDPLYLYPAPRILPGPSIDPAPVVLPAGSVDRAPLVEPAGAIEPAPQIAPAPAILPSNAIREKDRAYPQEKRFGKTRLEFCVRISFHGQSPLPKSPCFWHVLGLCFKVLKYK